MKILLINNDGRGFADYTDVPHGTTVMELFEREMGCCRPNRRITCCALTGSRVPATRYWWKGTGSVLRPIRSRSPSDRACQPLSIANSDDFLRQAAGFLSWRPAAYFFALAKETTTMSAINKPLLRLAVALHARLARRPGDRLIELPVQSWQRCAEIVRQIRRAELRGWQLAAEHLRTNLRHTIPRVEAALDVIVSQLPRTTTSGNAGLDR